MSFGGLRYGAKITFVTTDVTFSVSSCELSQPMGKIEFSSTAKTEQILSHR